jgi:hypothetical protein
MSGSAQKLAVPVFRSRVAPVLNWCSRIVIFSGSPAGCGSGEEMILLDGSAFERLRILSEEGVETLICGALSPIFLGYADRLGLDIICGVAGRIDEVCRAYHRQQLDQPHYWLPGCWGRGRYRKGRPCEGLRLRGAESNPGESCGAGRVGSGNPWICPHCGVRVDHAPVIARVRNCCPKCKQLI